MPDITLCVDSELYQAGFTDDGQPFIAEVFFAVAEAEDGRRWRHHKRFPGCRVEHYPEGEGQCFIDTRAEARLEAEHYVKVYGAINAAGLDASIWWEAARPCYGSAAWINAGQDHIELAREREEG